MQSIVKTLSVVLLELFSTDYGARDTYVYAHACVVPPSGYDPS